MARDDSARHRAGRSRQIAAAAAAELPADRGTDHGTDGRSARNTGRRPAGVLVTAFLARPIDRDVADHGLDGDDTAVREIRSAMAVAVAAASAVVMIRQRHVGAEQPDDRNRCNCRLDAHGTLSFL